MRATEGTLRLTRAGRDRRVRSEWVAALCAICVLAVASSVQAAPRTLGKPAKEGLELAKSGDCVAAVPVLERAELEDHRPVTAAALARCHIALGELLLAHEIYAALAEEAPDKAWDAADKGAAAEAKKAAKELDTRIPTVNLVLEPEPDQVEVRVGGRKAADVKSAIRVPPDEKIDIVVKADGYEPATTSILLGEGESKKVVVTLTPTGDGPPPKQEDPPKAEPDTLPKHWMGVRFRGLLLPQFVMNIVADGGRTTYLPGAGISYTARLEVVDIEPSITFTSYNLPTTAFKAKDTPDTEWELVESDLWGMTASVDILYRIPISPAVEMRIGAGFGVGWAFTGELYRWQSFPASGEAGDPRTYQKCNGPNDPAGTFRYCNQLDKDADRYGRPDDSWHDGGARPIVYPWLSLPQIGFAFRPTPSVAIDLELGVTLNGLMTGAGVRYGP